MGRRRALGRRLPVAVTSQSLQTAVSQRERLEKAVSERESLDRAGSQRQAVGAKTLIEQ